MANGQVPYVKETGVETFPDVEKWKSFGLNKSFSEQSTPAFPSPGPVISNYKLSDNQVGKSDGPLLSGSAQDKGL